MIPLKINSYRKSRSLIFHSCWFEQWKEEEEEEEEEEIWDGHHACGSCAQEFNENGGYLFYCRANRAAAAAAVAAAVRC